MKFVGPGFCNDVDEPAQRPPVLRAEAVVDDSDWVPVVISVEALREESEIFWFSLMTKGR